MYQVNRTGLAFNIWEQKVQSWKSLPIATPLLTISWLTRKQTGFKSITYRFSIGHNIDHRGTHYQNLPRKALSHRLWELSSEGEIKLHLHTKSHALAVEAADITPPTVYRHKPQPFLQHNKLADQHTNKWSKQKKEYPLVLTITNPAAVDASPSDCVQTPWIRCHFLVSVSLSCNQKTHSDKIESLEHFFHALGLAQKFSDSCTKACWNSWQMFPACFKPGIVNRTFGNRTQSKSIRGLCSIDFGSRTNQTLCEFDFRTNRTQSVRLRWIAFGE